MAALQRRLLDKLAAKGDFGIVDGGETRGTLRQTLLWRRGADTKSMARIEFPSDRYVVPSWSWMAHTGGIDYLNVGYGAYDWEDIQPP